MQLRVRVHTSTSIILNSPAQNTIAFNVCPQILHFRFVFIHYIYIYIYIFMNHFAVHLKLAQHCKSTILQFKKAVRGI